MAQVCKNPVLNGDASDLSPLQPSVFDQSRPGALGVSLPAVGVIEQPIETLLPGVRNSATALIAVFTHWALAP